MTARLLAVLLAILLASSAADQTFAAQVAARPSRCGGPNDSCPPSGGGGTTLHLNSPFARLILQAIGNEIANAGNTPPPGDTPPPVNPPPRQASLPDNPPRPEGPRPVFRAVPLPGHRPLVSLGRPLDFAASFEPDIVVVQVDDDLAEADLDALLAELHLSLLRETRLKLLPGRSLRLHIDNGAGVEDVVRNLLGRPGISGAQPSFFFHPSQATNAGKDLTGLQYAPKKIALDAAHGFGDGQGVKIGLIDTGIDPDQLVFAGADITFHDALDGVAVTSRDHGTAMAGLMIADSGLEGIAPKARLLTARAFDRAADGTEAGTSQDIAKAIDWAVAEGAQVLNLSFAGPRDPLVLKILDEVGRSHVIFVAAAGNNGPDAPPAFPGAHPDAIAVTATDSHDKLFSGANLGHYIAIAAPGVDVISPLPDDRFELLTGTSVATAHVSGIVALMLEQNPTLSREQIVADLTAKAEDLGSPGVDNEFGAGLVNAENAVLAARD